MNQQVKYIKIKIKEIQIYLLEYLIVNAVTFLDQISKEDKD
jgi:hypothetical protein